MSHNGLSGIRVRPSVAVGIALSIIFTFLISPMSNAQSNAPSTPIKHVVIIYQENHSFDNVFGAFCIAHSGRCDGYVGPVTLKDGTVVNMTQSPDVVPNVAHSVAAQTAAIDRGKMDGWANVSGCDQTLSYACLSYYTPLQIPNLANLATSFALSDRTFEMVDSPSWGGHLYAAAANLDGFTGDNPGAGPSPGGWGCDSNKTATWISPAGVKSAEPSCVPARPGFLDLQKYPYNGAFMPTPVPNIPTIFDRLDAVGLSWRIYNSSYAWAICPSFAECLYGPQRANVVRTGVILTDAKGTLPSVSILTPNGLGGNTSQHNKASMALGDNWIGQVVSAIETGPNWASTAIFITYDDCGCFYDHVPPVVNPDGTSTGIRVPMVIVSPYARAGFTDSTPATFSSILKFVEQTFGLPSLGANDAGSYDYSGSFNFLQMPLSPVSLMPAVVPASSRQWLSTHPDVTADNDPT